MAVTLLGAVQLICLGLLGEYVGRIYAATQNRPRYLVAYDTGDPTKTPPAQRRSGEGHGWNEKSTDEQTDVAFVRG